MGGRLKYYLLLHLTVFIFGFTGILGKMLEMDALNIVVYRMIIAFVGLVIYMKIKGIPFKARGKARWQILGVGVIIAAHWLTFFGSIQVSNVSIALACISSAAFFTSLVEPIIMKRKLDPSEMLMGVATVIGISVIMNTEFDYVDGIILSLISAFLAATFGVLNAKLAAKHGPTEISALEMVSGFSVTLLFMLIAGQQILMPNEVSTNNWIMLAILGLVATSFAFVATVWIMKELTPFTVAISINLEPIYAIIMALILFPQSEKMSPGFYYGASIIIGTILINAILKKRRRRKSNSPKQKLA